MRIRYIEVIRAGWGAALLIAPRTVLARVHGVQVDRKALVISRILGARHLVQASLSGPTPTPEILAAGIWVDSVHSLTALGLAVVDRSRARAGLVDAVVAALWAVFGAYDLRTGKVSATDRARLRNRLARGVIGALPGGRLVMDEARQARQRAS
jgi:hypothetical protein